mmetsp:Transcript_5089/g.14762  ORF Transcript_5089/g.14762 Transcript_5089/m.14762 type:complete len:379 (-) Transcript_5089:87-1223(-)
MRSSFQPHWDLYPKAYIAPKISFPLIDHLDGDLTKDVWKDVNFSDSFDDIRGPVDAPSEDRPDQNCRTRFKAVWDDTHLYIGAILESDFETLAHFTERNSPIYQKDSDFEVFVDPFGSCHNYKELEVNAINTVWNLMLDRPYDDDGHEFSGRIAKPGDDRYYEVYHQKTATKLLKGALNDSSGSATWSVEVALSYKDLLANTDSSEKEGPPFPSVGSMMRINFSRVERQGDTNWTWQPQIVWDPPNQRYSGFVAMHHPDAWGYMVFGDASHLELNGADSSTLQIPRDPTWPGRIAAMNVYYAQNFFFNQNNKTYAASMDDLRGLLDDAIVGPFRIAMDATPSGYTATVKGNPDGSHVVVTEDRSLRIVEPSEMGTDTA